MMTTTYCDVLIEGAAHCPVEIGKAPPSCGQARPVAALPFERLDDQPDQSTLDDVRLEIFTTLAQLWR
jgi:hypothetical protein